MKNSFAPIFTSMLDSSIWGEPYHVRILWTAMLALQDSDHIVRFNAYQLSRRANITEKEALDGLNVLASPDKRRQEKQPFDGRRIEKKEDGWFILNGQRFEEQMRLVSRRAYNARKQREYRNNKKTHNGGLPGESAAVRAENNDSTVQQVDSITTESLPESLPKSSPHLGDGDVPKTGQTPLEKSVVAFPTDESERLRGDFDE